MAARGLRTRRLGADYWPGFVDALATLLLVVIFVLSVFIVAQFYLSEALSGRDEALRDLNRRASELAELLALEKAESRELGSEVAQLSAALQDKTAQFDRLNQTLAQADQDLAARKTQIAELDDALASARRRADMEAEISASARAEIALLNQQIVALRGQLARIESALQLAEAADQKNKIVIAELSSRLNQALAAKVEELAGYRSEFFGRLRQVLGALPGIQVSGDRFIFQSEILFATGAAEIGPDGQQELRKVARALLSVAEKIPEDIQWILRVDGHTDAVPINNLRFKSNWELSAARAISVVKFLTAEGVPSERLAAAGFGEFQPLDTGEDEIARRRNRRIELKLTDR
ncbi:MAG TPA: peptidoglycan -binding protein [Alphaproteobacteria bacterium]|nr:peptidoglycan -binding protein [Alphaproteobacteria bacterium]HBF97503.1 peptidoglycan -binding protein [Alphaproteobacteria bacterium]